MNDQAPADPAPYAVERYPCGYAWRSRLQDVPFSPGEKAPRHSPAVREDAFWIVHDEGTMADFLPEDDSRRLRLITPKRYDSRERWKGASMHWSRKHWPESSPTQLDISCQ
jgi:hypothetical protein